MADEISLWHALTSLGPYIGAGGVTAIVVAYLGTRKPAATQAKTDPMQAMFADHFANERLTTEIKRVGDGLEELTHAVNRACDRIDMVQMFGQFNKNKDR